MAKNSISVFFTFVVAVLSVLVRIQIHAAPIDISNKEPVIMNAELKVVGKDGENNPIFDDLTNHLYAIKYKSKYYNDYLNEHKAQQDFRNQYPDQVSTFILDYSIVFHPKSIASIQAGSGPVFSIDGVSTGPIDSTSLHYVHFLEQFTHIQGIVKSMIAKWDQVRFNQFFTGGYPPKQTIMFSYVSSNGRPISDYATEDQQLYTLGYYRYLQLNPHRKATIQQELAAFEEKIKNRTGFQNARDGGIVLCNPKVPRVYCSQLFKFLGEIDSTHPYFDQYETYYLYEHGYEVITKDGKTEVKQKVQEEPKVDTVLEQLLKELPFHRLGVITESANILKVIDLDDKNQEVTKNHKYFKYYEEVARAQWNQKKERLEKRSKKEIPILVFELPNSHPKYVEQTEEGAVLRQVHFGNPDYEFAEWSHKEVQKTNEVLTRLKAALEKGEVHIEAKVRDLSKTPIFRINYNSQEISYQDPRYELIRFYHLKNLRKHKGRYQQRK